MKARAWGALLSLGLGGMVLIACSEPEPTTYVFRSAPPKVPTATNQATVSVGVLTGKIFLADSEELDRATGLPKGYRLLDGEAKVSVRVTVDLKTRTLNGTVNAGNYRVTGVPVGVPVQVTAGRTGTVSKTQSYAMPPNGQGRLDFVYAGGKGDSYLVGPPAYATPAIKDGK